MDDPTNNPVDPPKPGPPLGGRPVMTLTDDGRIHLDPEMAEKFFKALNEVLNRSDAETTFRY